MIEVSHLTKSYGPHQAIDDISFTVNKGEILGFLGPNGAGKTTTMKILTGFMPATSGEVKVAGYDVFSEAIQVKRNVGYLPESPPVYFEMIVRDYLEYAARLHDVPKGQVRNAVHVAMEKAGLTQVGGRLIGNLSKGYRQRVGLAQALVHNPQVLILDEPTVGLDPVQIIEIRDLIRSLGGEHTVILSTHILPEVTATCKRIIVINKGRIVAEDSIENLTAADKLALFVKDQNSAGVAAIEQLSGVKQVTPKDTRLVIQIADKNREIRDQIIQTAVQHQMGVLEFAPERVSLEEVFIRLTTQGTEV